jgi:hypothetical protein
VVAQVLGSALGSVEEPLLAREQVRGRKAVDEPGDRVGLLAEPLELPPLERDRRPVLAEVDLTVAPLGPQVEVRELAELLHPPVGALEGVLAGRAAEEDDVLRLEGEAAALRVEEPVGEQHPPAVEHVPHLRARVDVGIPQVADQLGVRRRRQPDVEVAAVDRAEREDVVVRLERDHRSGNRVGEREAALFHPIPPGGQRSADARMTMLRPETV